MKFVMMIFLAVSSTAMAKQDPPLCPGNKEMAKLAMEKSAEGRFGGPCRVASLKKNMHWPSEGREGYGADVQCPNTPTRRYSASVQKTNGICKIRFVTLHPLSGSQCGLTDTWGGDSDDDGNPVGPQWKFDDAKTVDLAKLKPEDIRRLPDLLQRQLTAAVDGAGNAEQAVQELLDGSEANEAYVYYFTFKNVKYVAVHSYPGGNPYGTIFEANSDQPFAKEGDGDISCVE